MSNFSDVAVMNEVFGNVRGDVRNLDWGPVSMYVDLIREEAGEVFEGFEKKDIKEMADGCLDLLVVAYGLAYVMGMDADEGMRRVFDSNMSKLCPTYECAYRTAETYKLKHGVDCIIFPVEFKKKSAYALRVVKDHTDDNGKFFPAGKFLKSKETFFTPDLESDGLFYVGDKV